REQVPDLKRRGRALKAEAANLQSVFRQLKSERQRQSLSLQDIADRSGIDTAHLSRLENARFPNVTMDTLLRYADALNKQVIVALADKG
ncbi:MAG TPA: XRE family transcriptional regulator, partial [Ramlibacter sp.]